MIPMGHSDMPQIYMYMFSMKSAGGLDVKKALGCQQIRHTESTFKGSPDKVVINWGCGSQLPKEVLKCNIINKPEAIYNAIDKREFLRLCTDAGVRTVPWTLTRREGSLWITQGAIVYCRTRLEGRQGQGIVIATHSQELVEARLYTKGISCDREYRVHVCDGEVIAVHRKVQDGETPENTNTHAIRNTENGWVFRRVTIYPKDITTQAIPAIKAAGLDFGVVDVLYDGTQAYVLEANTAPGIDTMEWTCEQYAKALKKLANKLLK